MRHCFIFLLLMLSLQGMTQVNLDSLWHDWENTELNDSTRLKSLGLFVRRGFLFQQPDTAFQIAEMGVTYARKNDHPLLLATFLDIQGTSLSLRGQLEAAEERYLEGYEISKRENDIKGIASITNNLGIVYDSKGDYQKAIDYYQLSLQFKEQLNDERGMAISLLNLGLIYHYQGLETKAMESYFKSLQLAEKIESEKIIASVLGNIGFIHQYQKDHEKAIEYEVRSMAIKEKIGDDQGLVVGLTNLGINYKNLGRYDTAIVLYERAIAIAERIDDVVGIGQLYGHMGNAIELAGDFEQAMRYHQKGYELLKGVGNKKGTASALVYMGQISGKRGNHADALRYGAEALEMGRELGALNLIKTAASVLYEANKAMGRSAQALAMYELQIAMQDSIASEENQKEIIRQEYKYTYEKQAAADSIKAAEAQKVADAQIQAQQAQISEERTQRFALYGGVGLLLLFGAFMYQRFRITQRQKEIISVQKTEVEAQKHAVEEAHAQLEEKNKEILDSITYAKRIQNAILPPPRLFSKHLPDSFILYKPKDIVAGDFYWMEAVALDSYSDQALGASHSVPHVAQPAEGAEHEMVLFAAADCTGHGVPGAMVSVICVNGLNRSVREFGLRDPAEILNKTRELVIKEFEKSDEEVKDGMDISLCALNAKTGELSWAGANNPLWIVKKAVESNEPVENQNNEQESLEVELLEVKADKQPIGKYSTEKPFTTHHMKLHTGDMIYLFSDGFPDQFGGKNGKKYKSGQFKRTLTALANKDLKTQKAELNHGFEQWRGTLEQIDDVCVIGVRV